MENSTLNKYELMLILLSDLGEQKINEEVGDVVKHIESVGGEVFNKDVWGVRDLAYKIRKHKEGYYVVLNFTFPPLKLSEFEKGFNINPAIIRSLLIRTPNTYVMRSFAEYQEEAEKMAAEKAKKPEAGVETKRPDSPKRNEAAKKFSPEVKTRKVVSAVNEVNAPSKANEEPKAAKKAAQPKEKLEEVDKKLKSIIDDPDITL
ncbi:MAG: 30S ribosomal protein S6 [Patescibacteria group bacterium]